MGTNKNKYYIYTWGFGEYKKKISHPEIIVHNYIHKLDLARLVYFAREWNEFQYIPDLPLPFLPYSQSRIQAQASQLIFIQKLRMNK